jgi:hypothetical protein
MESTSNSLNISNSLTQEKHKIYIKDKHGVYFLQPFVDQNKKLLNIENSSVVIKSKNLIGVRNFIILIFKRLFQEDSFIYTITLP